MNGEQSSQTVDHPPRSARHLLVEWANQQDGWVRTIVGEVLATRRGLSTALVQASKDRYLAEKQLADHDSPAAPPLADDGPVTSLLEPLQLRSLGNCTGVNALAEGQDIVFSPHLTVLFGENAAGKTGYVRVLKRLANVRSAEDIIPDIHRTSRTAVVPGAMVRYSIGDNNSELQWHNEKGVPPFTRMTVFDTPAVPLHLEDNVTYLYTPADVQLFRHVHEAIDAVRTLLEGEVAARQPRRNPFITAFPRNSTLFPKIESLSSSTNLAELELLARVTNAERSEADSLPGSIESLLSASPKGQSEMLHTRVTTLQNIIALCDAVTALDSGRLRQAITDEDRARDEQTQAAAAVFGGDRLPANSRAAWQAFIEAGERYLVAAGQTAYPNDHQPCIYCRQTLDAVARAVLIAYRKYAGGVTAATVQIAARSVAALQEPLTATGLVSAVEALRSILSGLEDTEQRLEWLPDTRQLLDGAVAVRASILTRTVPDTGELQGIAAQLLPRVRLARKETAATLKAIDAGAAEAATELAAQRARVALLEARITLSVLMPEIRAYVEQAQWAGRLRTLLGRFQGLLKSLTEASKVASEDLLNRDFERTFHAECSVLRAPTVTLDFPGRRGQAARRKTVAADHHLADILSESEQKVIALADFLAEFLLTWRSSARHLR